MARRINGKVVAITGGARGIGFETARALLAEGCRVAIGDIDADALADARAQLGGQVHTGVLDVTDRASFAAFLDGVEDAVGPLDVLVNNAGIMPVGAFVDEPDTIAQRQVDINVHGVILGMKLGLERMLLHGRGHIINVSSMAGIVPGAGIVTYTGTKFAVVGMTEAAHYEYGDRIDFSAVLPAFVNTALTSGTTPPRGVPMIEPSDVADGIVSAIRRPRAFVYAPPVLAATPILRSALNMRARTTLGKLMRLDRMFTEFDKDARRAYDERIAR